MEEPVVLVVEDEMIVRATLASMLRDAGFRVLEAGNGEEAVLQLATSADIRLLLTDINLKSAMDGFALATRARQSHPALAVLFTSGVHSVRERALAEGDGFLVKPYSPLDVIYQVVGLVRTRP